MACDCGSQKAGWSRGRGQGPWTRVWWSGSKQVPKPRGPRIAPKTQGANPGKPRVLSPIHLQGLPGRASVSPAFECPFWCPVPVMSFTSRSQTSDRAEVHSSGQSSPVECRMSRILTARFSGRAAPQTTAWMGPPPSVRVSPGSGHSMPLRRWDRRGGECRRWGDF